MWESKLGLQEGDKGNIQCGLSPYDLSLRATVDRDCTRHRHLFPRQRGKSLELAGIFVYMINRCLGRKSSWSDKL